MSNAEVVSYLLGADRAGYPGGIVGFLEMPWARRQMIMTAEQNAALFKLKAGPWAYWVLRGFDETRAAQDAL